MAYRTETIVHEVFGAARASLTDQAHRIEVAGGLSARCLGENLRQRSGFFDTEIERCVPIENKEARHSVGPRECSLKYYLVPMLEVP